MSSKAIFRYLQNMKAELREKLKKETDSPFGKQWAQDVIKEILGE